MAASATASVPVRTVVAVTPSRVNVAVPQASRVTSVRTDVHLVSYMDSQTDRQTDRQGQ